MPLASTSFLHTHPGWEATAKSKELLGETERQSAFARPWGLWMGLQPLFPLFPFPASGKGSEYV